MKYCLPSERPHTGAEKERKDEGARETKPYGLTTTLDLRSPMSLGREEIEEWGKKEQI